MSRNTWLTYTIVYVCSDKIRTAHFKTQNTHSAFLPSGLTFSPYGTSTSDLNSIIRLLKYAQPCSRLDAVYILPPVPEIVIFFPAGVMYFLQLVLSCIALFRRVLCCIVEFRLVSLLSAQQEQAIYGYTRRYRALHDDTRQYILRWFLG